MKKLPTTHHEILRGLLVAVPVVVALIFLVWWFVAGTFPSASVWKMVTAVFSVYVVIAVVASINAFIARRQRSKD